MSTPPFSDYYYGSEADQYTFYRLPKALFINDRYKNLSDGAKILYGLMLDRMGLSMKNGWLDEQNRVFIFFTLEDVQAYMNCKQDKGIKLLAELDAAKGVGLIERVKQGQGRPTKIYVKKFLSPTEVLTSEKPKSGLPDLPKSAPRQNRSLDLGKTDTNNTDVINNNFNDIERQSIHQSIAPETPGPSPRSRDRPDRMDGMDMIDSYREMIMDNIEYDCLIERYGRERLDGVVELMLETVCSKREYIRIASDEYPREVVKSRLLKVTSQHIEYVFDVLDKNTNKVYNIKAYLLTSLYNAPATIDHYYRAEVQHDLYGL